jgi:peptidoglycan hydrolase CwlO-like protein
LESQISDLRAERSEFESQLEAMRESARAVQSEKEVLESSFNKLKMESEMCKQEMEATLQCQLKELEALQSRKVELEAKVGSLEADLSKAVARNHELELEVGKLEAEMAVTKEEVEKLQAWFAEQDQKQFVVAAEVARLQSEIDQSAKANKAAVVAHEAELEMLKVNVDMVLEITRQRQLAAENELELSRVKQDFESLRTYVSTLVSVRETLLSSGKQFETKLRKKHKISGDKDQESHIGNYVHAFVPPQVTQLNWILDSGASKHVTGTSSEFTSYMSYPPTRKEMMRTADGTLQPIKGVGTVQCTQSIKLSSVLYVPTFHVNLISLSALVDQLDCRIILDRDNCLIQERQTGKKLGTATRRSRLWYMDHEGTNDTICTILATRMEEKEVAVMLLHYRLGHISFDKICKAFPDAMCGVDKSKLLCRACELAKRTRTSYISRGIRSISPFVLVHSDVWTCPVTSINGMKCFVTFIDCFSWMTWVYVMKHKDEASKYFQNFCAMVENQLNTQVKVLRTDNGTEYVNKEFNAFLSRNGILHQTCCPDTPPQNGVAEMKNHHILEVAFSLMVTMNVPKFLWSEAVLTATCLINRTPSKLLAMKTPWEIFFGENKFVVSPKIFGCTCFVRDHRPQVGKLDPRGVKCIFVGYTAGQKGYKCWSPSE